MYIAEGTNKPISFLQKRAVDLWLKGGRKNKAKALREAGYSRSVYRQPNKVFKSPAVQDYLDKGGFGRDGLHDNWKPDAKQVAVVVPTLDFSNVSQEALLRLKEQLGDLTYIPDESEVD